MKCLFDLKSLVVLFLLTPVVSWSQVGIRDSLDLEAFLDGMIEAQRMSRNIAGVTVSVVKDNKLFFSKGYGFSNAADQSPVIPETTRFRIGSISKLFVWTAVMQLAEQGKVDLDADINQYLNHFQIEETYETPITLKHLLTHTAGFEEYVLNLFSTDSLPPASLEAIFMEEMPERVRPPGQFSSYSNHGTGIAAYIVEQVSGLKWDEYVEQNIFAPLNMTNTTFQQPLPPQFARDHSEGYQYQGGVYQPASSFKIIPLAPVGVASTTAHDIVPFMIAHLQKGRYGNNKILDSTTAVQMHSALFQHAPGINGMCYGFFDHSKNGHKIIGHGGATEYFFSMMLLYPEYGAGIFVSTNTMGGMATAMEVTEAFTDRYFPASGKRPPALSLDGDYLNRFSGQYLTNRRPHHRFTKSAALVFSPLEVSVTQDGYLKTSGNPARYWEPIDSLTFMDRNSDRKMGFRRNEHGEVAYVVFSNSPHTAQERVPASLSANFHGQLFMTALGLNILALVLWTFHWVYRRRYQLPNEKDLPAGTKLIAMANFFVVIVFLVAMASALGENNDYIFRKRIFSDYLLFSMPILSAVLTLWQMLKAIRVFKMSRVRWRSKFFYAFLTVGFLILMWQAWFWNLLGFQFN